jgi:hypothetical protein
MWQSLKKLHAECQEVLENILESTKLTVRRVTFFQDTGLF